MFARCYNDSEPAYKDYGGRGVIVCERWGGQTGFANFVADMGLRPSQAHSIDRFPNNDGNYEPTNCRWATKSEQAANRRSSIMVTIDGVTLCLKDWCRRTGVSYPVAHHRVSALGWPAEVAVSVKNGRRPTREERRLMMEHGLTDAKAGDL